MPIVTPLLDGLRRVVRAPVILAGATMLTLLLALPLALPLHLEPQTAVGARLTAEAMAEGVGWDWWQPFNRQATGIERSFTPSVVGFAAVLGPLIALFGGDGRSSAIALVFGYVLVWTVFSGGVLDRYARDRPTRSAGFFAAAGLYGLRLIRLAIIAGLFYGFLFGVVRGWLLDDLYGVMTRGLTAAPLVFAIRAVLYVVFGALLVTAGLVFDYARVRAVVEDRRSMLAATLAAWRFVRRRPAACAGLYLANGLVFLAVMAAYGLVAPGGGGNDPSLWLAFLTGQAYIVAHLASTLLFYAVEIAYFQSQLAHAGYVAAPAAVWPESSAAEALGRLGVP